MSENVVFNEDEQEFHIKSRKILGEPETPTMIRLLLKSGAAKNEKQALIILLVAVLFMVVATILIIWHPNPNADIVTAPDGTKYSAKEYFRLVDSGHDPLNQPRSPKE
ncbi:MAG: hypothetical protein WCZ90_20180 [Melioribacteraceae bacterium]